MGGVRAKEDVYTFEWLEEIIDKLRERKIQVVLATPSGGMPHWLTQKYPETLQVQADGTVNLPGKRHNFCYSSPVMRRKVKQIDRALAQRFGKKENVILWHISNGSEETSKIPHVIVKNVRKSFGNG